MQARSARQMFAPARGDLARTIILGIELLRLSANTKSPAEGERSAGLLDWPEQAAGLACSGQQMEWGRSIARARSFLMESLAKPGRSPTDK